ncbi:OadG family protein [Celerinatantimonas diazotrophica]|uniref:Probable oxaloacetate decarboxylase gamma chain n=1 Tax=Celerinatantimonas diazotrophica TaxID=412034 RepID=A0A4R1K4D8_9GAMM|nr:OadG family transporter subunit [Celerinatantimonas diazotrophica]TCK58790.1 oxaloacetate decarboxylase gamma subunit [Celerinatantimonas diazotrophica]CAG9297422.1 oxaloacetate decarboxylase gamma chain [Celerinatantimonas diazotrophica]
MQETSLLMQGINLLTLGMGFVFIFLIFLVFATTAMSKLIIRYAPSSEPKAKTKIQSAPVSNPIPSDQLIAVLASAVHHHRAQRQAN